MTDDITLPPKQQAALDALLTEPTVAKAAQKIGITERTLYRWMNEPAFARVYAQHRRQAFGQAVALTQRYAPVAVQTLAKLMLDATVPASDRIKAATAILRLGREGIEIDDLQHRVAELESLHEAQQEAQREKQKEAA